MSCLLVVFGSLGIGVKNIDGRFDPDFYKVAWSDKLLYLKVSALDVKVTSWELYPSVVGRLRHRLLWIVVGCLIPNSTSDFLRKLF